MGSLQLTVTWYKIHLAGEQATHWDILNKENSSETECDWSEVTGCPTLNVVQGFRTLANLAVVRVSIFACKRGNTEIFAQI